MKSQNKTNEKSKKSQPKTLTSQKAGKAKKAKKGAEADPDDALLDTDVEPSEEIEGLEDFEAVEAEEPTSNESGDSGLETHANAQSTEQTTEEEIFLTDAEGRRLCRVRDCDQAASTEAYCRYHYLLNWKRIQVRRKILMDGKLERYVDELTSRYPDKFLEMIRKDLRTEKDFLASIAELEIDESGLDNDFEDESSSLIDEVRGVTESAGMSDDDEF